MVSFLPRTRAVWCQEYDQPLHTTVLIVCEYLIIYSHPCPFAHIPTLYTGSAEKISGTRRRTAHGNIQTRRRKSLPVSTGVQARGRQSSRLLQSPDAFSQVFQSSTAALSPPSPRLDAADPFGFSLDELIPSRSRVADDHASKTRPESKTAERKSSSLSPPLAAISSPNQTDRDRSSSLDWGHVEYTQLSSSSMGLLGNIDVDAGTAASSTTDAGDSTVSASGSSSSQVDDPNKQTTSTQNSNSNKEIVVPATPTTRSSLKSKSIRFMLLVYSICFSVARSVCRFSPCVSSIVCSTGHFSVLLFIGALKTSPCLLSVYWRRSFAFICSPFISLFVYLSNPCII